MSRMPSRSPALSLIALALALCLAPKVQALPSLELAHVDGAANTGGFAHDTASADARVVHGVIANRPAKLVQAAPIPGHWEHTLPMLVLVYAAFFGLASLLRERRPANGWG